MAFSLERLPSNPPPANGPSQSTQQPLPLCQWTIHAPQSGLFPRSGHTLTATGTAASKLFLFGGYYGRNPCASNDLYMFSTQDFSTTLWQTSGDVPAPRRAHGAALIGTTLLICGGKTDSRNVLNHDSLYLFNSGTSDLLISSPTRANHSFALQNCESGHALWSMVLGPIVVSTIPQPWSVPSFSSSVVGTARIISMICGHSI